MTRARCFSYKNRKHFKGAFNKENTMRKRKRGRERERESELVSLSVSRQCVTEMVTKNENEPLFDKKKTLTRYSEFYFYSVAL